MDNTIKLTRVQIDNLTGLYYYHRQRAIDCHKAGAKLNAQYHAGKMEGILLTLNTLDINLGIDESSD